MPLIGDALANVALFAPSNHAIGSIVPDVAIREGHRDAMVATIHPVEKGGVVSDHVYRRPAELELEYGYSNSTAQSEGYVQQCYAKMLKLKNSRQLQTIYTTKRTYKNMVVLDIATATDQKTKSTLILLIRCQELIIVSTQTTGTGTATTQPGTNQANPQSTGGVTDRGTVQTQDVGPQAFAGAYNPGQNPGGELTLNQPAGIGPGGFDPNGGALAGNPGLDGNLGGISPPLEITLPEQSVDVPGVVGPGGLQTAGPDQYNMFGAGP